MVLHMDSKRFYVLKDRQRSDGIAEWAKVLGVTDNEIAHLPKHRPPPAAHAKVTRIAGLDASSTSVDRYDAVRTPSPGLTSINPVTASTPDTAAAAATSASSSQFSPGKSPFDGGPSATALLRPSTEAIAVGSRGTPWLHDKMNSSAAAALIGGNPDGTFLVRMHGKAANNEYALSVMFKGKPTHHGIAAPPKGVRATVNKTELQAVGIVNVIKLLRDRHPFWPVPLKSHIVPVSAAPEKKPRKSAADPAPKRQSVIESVPCEQCGNAVQINEGAVGTPVSSGTFEVNIATPIGLSYVHAGSGKSISLTTPLSPRDLKHAGVRGSAGSLLNL